MKAPDMTGRTVGMWYVIGRDEVRTERAYWVCRCTECGVNQSVAGTDLRRSELKGGCRSCRRSGYASKHPVEYRIWCGIKARVFNPNREKFTTYSALGMYEPWAKDFRLFFDALGPRPSSRHTVDRIDNSRGYFPENVRWATPKEQARNTSRNLKVEGVCLIDYAKQVGVPYNTLRDKFHKSNPAKHTPNSTNK